MNCFSPAVTLHRKLKFPHKVILMGFLLLVPLLLLVFVFVGKINEEIAAADRERMGVEYSVELRKLLEQLPRYRGLVYLKLDEDELAIESLKIDQQLAAVQDAVRDIDTVNWSIGKELQVSDQWTRLKSKLKAVQSESSYILTENIFEQYSQLISDLVALMVLVGDTSGLILDPRIERYYLMDIMVRLLPGMINTTQTIRGLTSNKSSTNSEYNALLTTLVAVLKEQQTQFILAQTKVQQENPHLRDRLDNKSEKMLNELAKYNRILYSEYSELTVLERFEKGTEAIQSIFSLYDFVADELDNNLEEFIVARYSSTNWIFAGIFFCLSISIYLAIGFYLSIIGDIRALLKATDKISDGDVDHRINIRSGDELSQVAIGFNSMADALEDNQIQIADATSELESMTKLDPLTQLPNRRYMEEVLDVEWKRAIRTTSDISALMMDIDHFKKYNDNFGHQKGDECLKKVALSLTESLNRVSDFAARYGGEEFILILPNTPVEGAVHVAKLILDNLNSLNIPHPVDGEMCGHVTLSIGIVSLKPSQLDSCNMLVKRADQALYQAKANGRNQYVVYTDDDNKLLPLGATEDLAKETDLK